MDLGNDIPFVSIIIPVFNDSERLRLCLTSLENQTYSKAHYEVIVVDNNSEENIQKVTNGFNQVKLIQEMQRGSYAARNAGIAIARGSIFGFTDSDCIPANNWIEFGVKNLQRNPNCGLVAGRIDFYFQKPDCPNAAELWDSLNHLRQKKYVEKDHFGATANVFTLKSIFESVGLFDPSRQSGGDQEWGKRVFAAGFAQVYADDVCIQHPARSSMQELKIKLVRVAEGHYTLHKNYEKSLMTSILEYIRDARPAVRYVFELLFKETYGKDVLTRMKFAYLYIVLRHAWAWEIFQLDLKLARNTQLIENK
jgi:glycosyltransferase involved in cell wall biosynthesis